MSTNLDMQMTVKIKHRYTDENQVSKHNLNKMKRVRHKLLYKENINYIPLVLSNQLISLFIM